MQQPSKNSLSICGIAIAISSLWATWLVFQNVAVESPFGELQQSLLGRSEPVTFSGSLTGFDASLFGIPILVVVLLICAAHAIQLMDAMEFFHIPSVLKWLSMAAALAFSMLAIVYPLFRVEFTPSLGPYIALLAAGISATTLLASTGERDRNPNIAE